jgi:hypothetical protein
VAEPICLNCPKEYWIAFVLESQGEEELAVDSARTAIPASDLELFACFPVSGSEANAALLSLVNNVVWLDPQGVPTNDVSIDHFLCQDIEAHVKIYGEPAYQKVLP